MTRAEQELAAARIRTWPPDVRRAIIALPPEEREHVILAIALMDARPGKPSPTAEVIEIP